MSDYVRVELENGSQTTVGREFAEIHNLKVIDDEAVDRYGRPYPEAHPEVPEGDQAAVLGFDLDTAGVAELRAEIDRRNALPGQPVQIEKGRTKAELQAALKADDARIAGEGAVGVSGNDEVDVTPSGHVVVTGQGDDA